MTNPATCRASEEVSREAGNILKYRAGLTDLVSSLLAVPCLEDVGSLYPVFPPQDVDAAYMNKVELEGKVDSLNDEISFLKTLNETVSSRVGGVSSSSLRKEPR